MKLKKSLSFFFALLLLGGYLVYYSYINLTHTKVDDAKILLGEISKLSKLYEVTCKKIPENLSVLNFNDPECPKWNNKSHTLESVPTKDPWGHPLGYRYFGNKAELRSLGRDGIPETNDDIVLIIE